MMSLLAANAGIAEENKVPTTSVVATNKFENFVFFMFLFSLKNIKFDLFFSYLTILLHIHYPFSLDLQYICQKLLHEIDVPAVYVASYLAKKEKASKTDAF